MKAIPNAGADVLERFVAGFFSPVAQELDDPDVSEILINGPFEIYVERSGLLSRSKATFSSENQLLSALRAVAQFLGRSLDDRSPLLEGRLPDGSRISALLSPLVSSGPCVAIRKHRTSALRWEDMVASGTINRSGLDLLAAAVVARKNILVSGGTGSGKTSILRCLTGFVPAGERIVSIEDARELALDRPHVVSLEARPADPKGQGSVTIGDLFIASLRLRPDRIVIGEIRGGEAFDLIQAMTSGHGGCLSTIHASSPEDALRRLETLALFRGLALPISALRSQVISAVDLIVQVERRDDGRRRIATIAETSGLDDSGRYRIRTLADRPSQHADLVCVSEARRDRG